MEKLPHLIQVEYLSPRKQIEQEFIDCLTCPLCLCIVMEPMECVNCEKLYCSAHVKEWTKTKKTCPTCRAKPWKLKTHCHRIYMQLLETLEFSCPCGKDVHYKELIKHGFWTHIEVEKSRKKLEEELELKKQKEAQQQRAREEARRLEQQQQEQAIRPVEPLYPKINIVSVTRRQHNQPHQKKPSPPHKIIQHHYDPILQPILPARRQPHVVLNQSMIRSRLEQKFNVRPEQEKHEQAVPAVVADKDKEQALIPLDPTKRYYFSFSPKAQQTVFLNRQSNEQINTNLRNKITSFDLLIDSKHVLYFELEPMKVTDPVREKVYQLDAEQIVGAVWRYSLNRRDFVYPPEIAAIIEKAYATYRDTGGLKTIPIQFENTHCEVNFEKMEHTNLDTKSVRPVKRRQF